MSEFDYDYDDLDYLDEEAYAVNPEHKYRVNEYWGHRTMTYSAPTEESAADIAESLMGQAYAVKVYARSKEGSWRVVVALDGSHIGYSSPWGEKDKSDSVLIKKFIARMLQLSDSQANPQPAIPLGDASEIVSTEGQRKRGWRKLWIT